MIKILYPQNNGKTTAGNYVRRKIISFSLENLITVVQERKQLVDIIPVLTENGIENLKYKDKR